LTRGEDSSGVAKPRATDANVVRTDREVLDGVSPEGVNPTERPGTPFAEELWSPAQRQATASYEAALGELAAMRGQTSRALSHYQKAYDLDPNPFLGAKVLSFKGSQGDPAEALQEARRMVLLYPKDGALRMIYAQTLARSGKFAEAIPVYEEALRLNPRQEQAWQELTGIHFGMKAMARVVETANRFTKAMPESPTAWLTLAKVLLLQGQKKEALTPARRSYEMQPRDVEAVVVYALALEFNKESRRAIALYEELYRFNPSDDGLVERMVEIYREMGDLKEALALLEEMRKRTGVESVPLDLQRAYLLWELGRFPEAAAILARLAEEHPESDRLAYMNGLGQERVGQPERALKIYEALPAKSPFRAHGEMRSIFVLRDLKRAEEALARSRRLMGEDDPPWEAFEVGAHLLGDMDRHSEAVTLLKDGLERVKEKDRLLFVLGVYQEKSGDIAGCVMTMREVIRRDPTNASAMNFIGYLFAEQGVNLDEAEQLIRKAMELKPKDGFFVDSLGWVYFKRKEYARAMDLFEKAARLVPDEGVIYEHMGDVHLARGAKDKARASFEKALKNVLEDRDRKRIEEKVQALRAGGKLK
jgi:tetratricopeptide (TPR) repeat protein